MPHRTRAIFEVKREIEAREAAVLQQREFIFKTARAGSPADKAMADLRLLEDDLANSRVTLQRLQR